MKFSENNFFDFGTPCFIFDEAEFGRGIDGFRGALEEKFGKVTVGYSVKTNSLPYALRMAGDLSHATEVSGMFKRL